jgi:hypothetical protein
MHYQIAPMNIKAGLLNNVDFQLVLQPYQWQRIEDKTTGRDVALLTYSQILDEMNNQGMTRME